MRNRSILRVRRAPGARTRGILRCLGATLPVALGRAGIRANKREGDGATPRGRFRLVRVWWREDRTSRPNTLLPARPIRAGDAWCEDPTSRLYNRPIRLTASDSGDRLWRDDALYDLIVELDHNMRPRVANRGSAIFVHVARPDLAPTAGCVALNADDLKRLLARLPRQAHIEIR